MSEISDSESVADSDFASGSIADMEPDPAGPMFPLVATYVVFTIDPVATLASLDDPEVTAAASNLRPKKYVGYVRNTASARNIEAEFMAYRMDLLRQGPTPKQSERFVESDMCVPVLPNTAHHPLDRPPLQPTTPLPWPDCYHSSFDTAIVRVPMKRAHATAAVELPPEEMKRQIYFQVVDRARRRALRQAHEASHPETQNAEGRQTGERHASRTESVHEASTKTKSDAHESVRSDTSSTREVELAHENIQNIVAMMDETQPSNTMPLAVMTYDLSTTDAVSDPQEFYKECWVLRELEREHHERNKANTVAAIERARKLDDEAFANISRQQPKLEPAPESMPAESSAPQTDIQRPSVRTVLKRSVLAVYDYFDEHPFWGKPVDPLPPTTVAPRRLGVKLRNLAKHCACGMLGHMAHSSSKTREQREQKVKVPVVLSEKAPVIDNPELEPGSFADDGHQRASADVSPSQTEQKLQRPIPQLHEQERKTTTPATSYHPQQSQGNITKKTSTSTSCISPRTGSEMPNKGATYLTKLQFKRWLQSGKRSQA